MRIFLFQCRLSFCHVVFSTSASQSPLNFGHSLFPSAEISSEQLYVPKDVAERNQILAQRVKCACTNWYMCLSTKHSSHVLYCLNSYSLASLPSILYHSLIRCRTSKRSNGDHGELLYGTSFMLISRLSYEVNMRE